MKIDESVGPLVRAVLAAGVEADPARFARALAAFPDEPATTAGSRLAAAVAVYVLHDQYGRPPSWPEIRAAAGAMAKQETWAGVGADEVVALLRAIYSRGAVDGSLAPDRAALVPYVLAANLLRSCHRDGERWSDYLARALTAIEGW